MKTLNHRTIERDEARAKLAKLREAVVAWRKASFSGSDHEYQVAAEPLAALAEEEA